MSLRRPVTAVTIGFGIALTIPFLASAHTSGASATCNGITTSLQFFENAAGDRVYTYIDDMVNPVDTFPGPFVTTTHTVPVPQDGVSHDWKVVVDSVSGTGGVPGNGTQFDATYIGQVGPCGEVQTTTTSTEVPTSTSTTQPAETTTLPSTTEPSTTVPTVTTVPTSTQPSTTTTPTTSSEPATSSSVATTSTTSSLLPTSTTQTPSSTEPPAPSSSTPPSTTLPPECSDNPNTPTDDCAPVCSPVTLDDGTNSCATLPPTGAGTLGKLVVAWCFLSVGLCLFIAPRFRKG